MVIARVQICLACCSTSTGLAYIQDSSVGSMSATPGGKRIMRIQILATN